MNNSSAEKNLSTADIADAQRTGPLDTMRQPASASDPLDQPATGTPNILPFNPRKNESQTFSGSATSQPNYPDLDQGSTGQPVASSLQASETQRDHADTGGPLFAPNQLQEFRSRWDRAQSSFVDEPRQAVQQADSLVASVVQRIAEQFADERASLEKQWDRGDNVSTEDLRQALKRYRAFFDRLLSF